MPKSMKLHGSLILLSAGLFVCCPGCATVGRDFPAQRIAEIKIGETTKSDLLAYYGRPYRRGVEDGDSTWTYVHYKLRLVFGKTATRDLYVRFDGNRVRSYTYNADVP